MPPLMLFPPPPPLPTRERPLSVDLRPFLPEDWQHDLKAVSDTARSVLKEGAGPGSLNLGRAAGLDYWTLARDELLAGVPWLGGAHDLLRRLVDLAAPDKELRELNVLEEPHGLSMNVVTADSAIGGGYEWHVDGGEIDWVCVLTTRSWMRSGRFQWHDGQQVHQESLTAGHALVLRSSKYPHSVEPPKKDRISVMFALTYGDAKLRRETELSEWLGQGAS